MSKIVCPEPGSQLTIGSVTAPNLEGACVAANIAADIAESELDRLRTENAALREALGVAMQAIMEMAHAHSDPNWFTNGQRGAHLQFFLWHKNGMEAIRAALAKVTP